MKIIQEFREFAAKGNVMDLAVGVIIGAAFGKIVTSLVNDMIMPPIGAMMKGLNFKDLYLNLSGTSFPDLDAARKASAPILAYGAFLNTLLEFLIVAFAVFLLIKQLNRFRREAPPVESDMRECPHCITEVPKRAVRCAHCTSPLEPLAEAVAAS